jgi:hypothetical protein
VCVKVCVRLSSFLIGVFASSVLVAGCSSEEEVAASADQELREDSGRYLELAARHGVVPRRDRPLVIGIRGRDLAGNVHPTRVAKVFDDTLVVVLPSREVLRLAVSTHPWETTATTEDGVPDVDRDTKPDVGMIRPGTYLASRREASRNIAGASTYQVTTTDGADRLPGYRNTDHDASYTAAEIEGSRTRRDGVTAVLFHQAGDGAPKAVGCQVLDAPSMRLLADKTGDRFDYLLVDANEGEVP